jgi:hypothetical protein
MTQQCIPTQNPTLPHQWLATCCCHLIIPCVHILVRHPRIPAATIHVASTTAAATAAACCCRCCWCKHLHLCASLCWRVCCCVGAPARHSIRTSGQGTAQRDTAAQHDMRQAEMQEFLVLGNMRHASPRTRLTATPCPAHICHITNRGAANTRHQTPPLTAKVCEFIPCHPSCCCCGCCAQNLPW